MVLRFPEGYWHFLEIFSSLLDEHRKRLSCNISISVSAKPACSFLSAFWLTWPGTLVLQVDLNPYSKSLCLLGAFVSENLFWFCSSCSFDCANLLEPTSCTIRYVPINDINDPLFSFFFFFSHGWRSALPPAVEPHLVMGARTALLQPGLTLPLLESFCWGWWDHFVTGFLFHVKIWGTFDLLSGLLSWYWGKASKLSCVNRY